MKILFAITFLFALFTSILAFPSSNLIPRQLGQFQVCDSNVVYPIQVTKLTYTPDPMVIGQPLQVEMAGTTQVQVEQNTILRFEGIVFVPIVTYNADLCNEILSKSSQQCPIPVGNFNFLISIILPNKPELSKLNGIQVRITREYNIWLKTRTRELYEY